MRRLRRGLGLALALLAGGGAAKAQSPEEPSLIFTISAGYLTGGRLWNVDRQAAPAAQSSLFDTLAVARLLRPGFAATLSATYFRSPHLGYSLEAGFFGIGTESRCRPAVPYVPDPYLINEQACNFVQGENIRGDAVGFLAGLIWRFTTRGAQPFIRVAAGPAILGSSFVETYGVATVPGSGESNIFFLTEQTQKQLTWMVSLGVGAMLPLAPGYQLHIEARDVIIPLPVATGAAAPDTTGEHLPFAPTSTRVMHVPTITIGLDVVLERKRGRRY
jgi:hypothetical protein